MDEQITTLLVSLAPSLGAVVTVIVSMVKLIKAFGSNSENLKKDVNDKIKYSLDATKNMIQSQKILLEENETLKNTLKDLTERLGNVEALGTKIDSLYSGLEETKEQLTKDVTTTLNNGLAGVEQIKKEAQAIGSDYNEKQEN